MKRIAFLLLVTLFTVPIFQSCETDFDVTAPWQDITVVYGLISQNDSVHYIKINKAFLGEGNALEYAQNADSSSYGNNLEVVLIEMSKGNELRRFNLDTTSVYNKEPGLFYAPRQIIYKSAFKVPADYSSKELIYNLEIRNKLTGKIITASTPLVYDFNVPYKKTLDFTAESLSADIDFLSVKNGRRYTGVIRFWFDEIMANAINDTIQRYIDWNIGSVKSRSIEEGGENLKFSYPPKNFFPVCDLLIPYSSDKESEVLSRLVSKFEILILVAADELNTYMEANEPSSGLQQDKPEYTNINNGIGLFSSRFLKSSETINSFGNLQITKVHVRTEERLISGNLKFVKKIGN